MAEISMKPLSCYLIFPYIRTLGQSWTAIYRARGSWVPALPYSISRDRLCNCYEGYGIRSDSNHFEICGICPSRFNSGVLRWTSVMYLAWKQSLCCVIKKFLIVLL